MLLYHIIVVAIDLKCPSILGIHVNFRGVPYHSGGFSANANITQPDLGQQSICDRVSVSTYAWHWESSHFSDLHPVGTTRGSQKHPSHPHCWWFNSYWMDGSGAPQCPTCHTLVSGSISTHSCGILSVVIFQTKIRVAHGLKQKTDGWTTELKHVKYKHVPPTNATIFKPPRYPRHPNSLK